MDNIGGSYLLIPLGVKGLNTISRPAVSPTTKSALK